MSMKLVKNILRGIIIGIANIIPGVSGGTLAVSMGVYDKIISAVTNLFREPKKSIKTLMPFAIGMGLGIVGLSFVIEWLFINYPFQTNMLFIGLIIGCIPVILPNIKGGKLKISYVIAFLVLFFLVVSTALFGKQNGVEVVLKMDLLSLLYLFGVGIIASATMVIPGVSGSMVLTIMGYYMPIVEQINSCIRCVLKGDIAGVFAAAGYLIPFGIGVLLGVFLIAKLIDFIFLKAKKLAFYGILGLITASPIAILVTLDYSLLSPIACVTGVISLLAGLFVAYKLAD